MEESRSPPHWELLDAEDQEVYQRLNAALSAPVTKSKRNKRINDFRDIVDAIDLFENSDETNKWKRCLVCGVCKLQGGIAVNIAQLKRLICKCKSSINGSLKGLGFDKVISKGVEFDELLHIIPYLKDSPGDLRQWTLRFPSNPSRVDSETVLNLTPPHVDFESTEDGNSFVEIFGSQPSCSYSCSLNSQVEDKDLSISIDESFNLFSDFNFNEIGFEDDVFF